jgi:TPR repeat protein
LPNQQNLVKQEAMLINLNNYGLVSLKRLNCLLQGNQFGATHLGSWDALKDIFREFFSTSKQQRLRDLWDKLYPSARSKTKFSNHIETFIVFSQLRDLAHSAQQNKFTAQVLASDKAHNYRLILRINNHIIFSTNNLSAYEAQLLAPCIDSQQQIKDEVSKHFANYQTQAATMISRCYQRKKFVQSLQQIYTNIITQCLTNYTLPVNALAVFGCARKFKLSLPNWATPAEVPNYFNQTLMQFHKNNFTEGVELIKKAVEQHNDHSAINNLGFCYQLGIGISADLELAAQCYQDAANLGNTNALTNLGYCYLEGKGVAKDETKAVELFNAAATLGNSSAINNLAFRMLEGLIVGNDVFAAVRLFYQAAKLDNAAAANNLAVCYQDGIGVAKNEQLAFDWYHTAARLGDSGAMNNLALCYANGKGVAKNAKLALAWFQKAAELANSSAMNNLGVCYQDGFGVTSDVYQALRWYHKAAKLENATAMGNLGCFYIHGIGFEKNETQAVKWFHLAAALNDSSAMGNLGYCYQQGVGVNQDIAKAAFYFNKAALVEIQRQNDASTLLGKLEDILKSTTNLARVLMEFVCKFAQLPPTVQAQYTASPISLKEFRPQDKVIALKDPNSNKLIITAVFHPRDLLQMFKVNYVKNPVNRQPILFADPNEFSQPNYIFRE